MNWKVRHGKTTGEVTELDQVALPTRNLVELRESFDLDEIEHVATGDGANDQMIEAAAVSASPCSRSSSGRGRRGKDRLRRSVRCCTRRAIGARSRRDKLSSSPRTGTRNHRCWWLSSRRNGFPQTLPRRMGPLGSRGRRCSCGSGPTARSARRSAVRRRHWRPIAPTPCRPS